MILRFFLSAMLVLAAQCIRAEPVAREARSLGQGDRMVYLIPGLASSGRVWDELAGGQADQAERLARFMGSLTPEQYAEQNRMVLASMITDPQDVETIAQLSRDSDPATVGRAVTELMTIDIRPLMADIEVPVTLIQAADSGSSQSLRAAFADQVADIPDHRHVVADTGRHFVQIDDPDAVAREVLALLEGLEDE